MESKETTKETFTDEKQSKVTGGIDQLADLMRERHPEFTSATTDEEFQEIRFSRCVARILKVVREYPVESRAQVVSAALKVVTNASEAVTKINQVEQEIRRTCEALLDTKSKAVIAVLNELSSMSGITKDVGGYATNILLGGYGQDSIEQANREYPDDANVTFISHIFKQARSVNNIEPSVV